MDLTLFFRHLVHGKPLIYWKHLRNANTDFFDKCFPITALLTNRTQKSNPLQIAAPSLDKYTQIPPQHKKYVETVAELHSNAVTRYVLSSNFLNVVVPLSLSNFGQ